MVNREDIQATCDDIVREFAPLQVILLGPMRMARRPKIQMLICSSSWTFQNPRQVAKPGRFSNASRGVSGWICLCGHLKKSPIAFRTTIGFSAKSLKKVMCSISLPVSCQSR